MTCQDVAIFEGSKKKGTSKIFNAILFAPNIPPKCNYSTLKDHLTDCRRT